MKKYLSFALLTATAFCTSAQAAVLMLDFGATTVTGASLTNSPYHTVNGSFTDTTWNKLETADAASGLFFSDSLAATGVGVDLGSSTTTVINLSTQPTTSSALGNHTNTGVYGGTSVGTDAIFSGSGVHLGLQVGGLTAGTYDIYVTARNTNILNGGSAYTQQIFVGTSASSGNFDYAGYSSGDLSYDGVSSQYTTAWVEGENYIKLTAVLGEDEFLNIASADTRGFLNSVQIVAVPEPGTVLLLGLGALGCLVCRRRR